MEDQYQALYTTFRWWVPQRFNLAEACCRRWNVSSGDARRIALYTEDADGHRDVWTFARLQEYANRLSNGLRRTGVQRSDRVAIALPQRAETLLAHLACYQLGAIAVPLPTDLPGDVFEQRLRDSEARVVLVDPIAAEAVLPAVDRCPRLRQAIGIDLFDERVLPWRSLIARQESAFEPQPTAASDPAILLYTAGAAGAPKGVVLPHAALIGNLPGFVAAHDWFPQPGDVLWSPSDWASAHGLFGAVLPSLYFGQPLVCSRRTLAPGEALDLIERYRVTSLSIAPSPLRALVEVGAARAEAPHLRSIAVADGPLDEALFTRCAQVLGVTPNEVYGQAEVGAVIGHSREKWRPRAGSMGRPYPGHQVIVADAQGRPLPPGEVGEILVNRADASGHPDPAFFVGYWRGEEAGRPSGGTWHRTGDMARVDEDGYFWFAGRAEDRFAVGSRSSGPEPIEACLQQFDGVADVAVIALPGSPTQLKAFVKRHRPAAEPVPGPDLNPELGDALPATPEVATPVVPPDDDAWSHALLAYAGQRLPAEMVPHVVEILPYLPRTASGKLRRQLLRQLEEERSGWRSGTGTAR